MNDKLIGLIESLIDKASDADIENAVSFINDYKARYPRSFATAMKDINQFRPSIINAFLSEHAYRNQPMED